MTDRYENDDPFGDDEFQTPKRTKRGSKHSGDRPTERRSRKPVDSAAETGGHDELADEQGGWSAPRDCTTHSGTRIDRSLEFFEPPPDDIGPVISAWSTLKYATRARSPGTKIGLTFLSVVVVGAIFGPLGWVSGDAVPILGMGLVFGILLSTAIYYLLNFKHTVSYVCQFGVAKYTLRGSRHGR